MQAKTLDDLRRMHPHFVQHWDPVTFGRPWLQDYTVAPPERRADLDLASPPDGVRSPLALAFYWIRWLPNGGADVPVFLPGWKKDKVMDVRFDASVSPAGTVWHVPLHHPSLTSDQPSSATVLTSTDHHLMRLSFDLHGPAGRRAGGNSAVQANPHRLEATIPTAAHRCPAGLRVMANRLDSGMYRQSYSEG